METKIDQTLISKVTENFLSSPSNLTWNPFYYSLKNSFDEFKDNRQIIVKCMEKFTNSGNKVPLEVENIIYATFFIINLAVGKDIKHNMQQAMNKVALFHPYNTKYADMLWNIIAICLMRESEKNSLPLPKQWEAMILNYTSKTSIQKRGYCVGLALLANPNNAEVWLHLGYLFNNTKLVLDDLPQELIASFKQEIYPIHPLKCSLFCCEQVLKNKHTNEMFQAVTGMRIEAQRKLLSLRFAPLEIVAKQPVQIAQPITSPIARVDASSMNQEPTLEKIMKKIQKEKVDCHFFEGPGFTISDAKIAINSIDILTKTLKLISIISDRPHIIYALFKDSNETGRNSCRSKCDEQYIKGIIKTKNDFEAILKLLPKNTPSSPVNTRVENKYKKSSSHIASLYGISLAETSSRIKPKKPASNIQNSTSHIINQPIVNPCSLNSTLFSQSSHTFCLPPFINPSYVNGTLFSQRRPISRIPLDLASTPSAPGTIPVSNENPNSVHSTLFSLRPTISRSSITSIANEIPVYNAIAVDDINGGSLELNNQEMEIETPVIRDSLKRRLEISSDSEVDESATKKLKI